MGLAKNSVETFISKSAMHLVHLLSGILTARFLGPEGKGLLYLLLTSISLCALLAHFGLGTAGIYLIGRDRKRLPAVVANHLVVTGIVGVIVSIAVWLFLRYGRADISAQLPLWIWSTVVLLVPLHLLHSLLMQVLSAVLRIKAINYIGMTTKVVRLLLLGLFLVVLNQGVAGAFLAHACANVLSNICYFLTVLHYGGRPSRPDMALLGVSLRYGVKSYFFNLTRYFNLRLDTFLVTTLAVGGVHATGIYSVATSMAELMIFIPVSIFLSLFPMVASQSAAEANRLTSASCRHTLFLTLICALAMATLGPLAIRYLYGERFAGAVLPLLILLPGVVMLSQAHIFYSDLNGRGKPEASAISTLLALVVTVGLDFVLIPRYGITGAAVASTCAYGVEFLTAGAFFFRTSSMRWRDVLVFRKSDLDYYVRMLPRIREVGTSRGLHS